MLPKVPNLLNVLKMAHKKPKFTFQLDDDTLANLDKLRQRETSPPTRSAMMNILVRRAAQSLEKQEVDAKRAQDD